MRSVRFEDLSSELPSLLGSRLSFQVVALGSGMSDAVKVLEREIEAADLTCRVFLHGRTLPGLLSWPAGHIFLAAHNLWTLDPDYEIAKHKIDNRLTVTYKKAR